MELILLGGNSVKNKEWIEEVENYLKEDFDSTHVHYYKHWETGEALIDINYEVNSLANYLSNKEDYVIFAKSAGCLVVVKGVYDGKISPSRCVFAGFPVAWAKENKFDLDNWLNEYSVKTSFVQNSHDPAIFVEDLRNYLDEMNFSNYKIIELEGDTHSYDDLEKPKEIVNN